MEEVLELIQKRQAFIEQVKALEETRKSIDVRIEAFLGPGTHRIGSYSVIIQDTTENRFDTTAFKKAHPELVEEFNKTGNKHIFRIVEVSE